MWCELVLTVIWLIEDFCQCRWVSLIDRSHRRECVLTMNLGSSLSSLASALWRRTLGRDVRNVLQQSLFDILPVGVRIASPRILVGQLLPLSWALPHSGSSSKQVEYQVYHHSCASRISSQCAVPAGPCVWVTLTESFPTTCYEVVPRAWRPSTFIWSPKAQSIVESFLQTDEETACFQSRIPFWTELMGSLTVSGKMLVETGPSTCRRTRINGEPQDQAIIWLGSPRRHSSAIGQ